MGPNVSFLARKTRNKEYDKLQDKIWTYQFISKSHICKFKYLFRYLFIHIAFHHIIYFLQYKNLKLFCTAFFYIMHHHWALIKPSSLFLLHWKILNTNSGPNELYFGYRFQLNKIILSINASNHCDTTRNERQEDSLRAFSNQSIIQTRQIGVFALID